MALAIYRSKIICLPQCYVITALLQRVRMTGPKENKFRISSLSLTDGTCQRKNLEMCFSKINKKASSSTAKKMNRRDNRILQWRITYRSSSEVRKSCWTYLRPPHDDRPSLQDERSIVGENAYRTSLQLLQKNTWRNWHLTCSGSLHFSLQTNLLHSRDNSQCCKN